MAQVTTEIDALVTQQDQSKLINKLERLVDQFLSAVEHYSDEQIATFDDVISRMAAMVDPRALEQLSRRLSTEPNAPPGMLRQLATHDRIEVAEPVLVKSECLEQDELVEFVETQPQTHLLAISRRVQIGPEVSDALIRRGDQSVVRALFRNKRARFSDRGVVLLARRIDALRQEKRRVARKIVNYPATLILPEDGERLACTLIDISKTGAKLSLNVQLRVPDIVYLKLAGNGDAMRKCSVAWRNRLEIGVRFVV